MTTATLMPTEEWIGFMLDLWHPGWRTTGDCDDLLMVEGQHDDEGPWLIQTTSTDGELILDGERCFSAAWR